MNLIVKIIVENIAVGKSKHHEMTALRDSCIEPVQQFDEILFELLWLGHAVERLFANIVSD